ncbi:hypothetical protein K457DRAFT_23592 [Linnemannia elongata AG-77]|uniref:Uncharacterized protein n=1 Tax=Linnemannia elongata AG-77 TaxID=1314771 RepID=A0A197JKW2_9FUNG|nr:hypothetical protein K457DRAFT_23592 [Linnemannia elongata AG-77]
MSNSREHGHQNNTVITYPSEVVKFQVIRPDPEPELEGLERVSIDTDDNNFHKSFQSDMSCSSIDSSKISNL